MKPPLLVTIWIACLLVFTGPLAFSSTVSCGVYLERTLGVEWEFSAIRSELDSERMDGLSAYFASQNSAQDEMYNCQFKDLFGFFGKASDGTWVQNLIPRRVVSEERFRKMQKDIPQLEFAETPDGLRMVNAQAIGPEGFSILIRGLHEARGKFQVDLKLRKIPAAWIDKQSVLDLMIPDELAEEWRRNDYGGNDYVGFEFPMAGAVSRRSDIHGYIKNLFVRLGLFNNDDPRLERILEIAKGHIHFVAHIWRVEPLHRQALYEATVNLWGDRNDNLNIEQMDVYRKNLNQNNAAEITKSDVVHYATQIENIFKKHYSVGILTRETYARIRVTPDGLLIADRDSDLDSYVDPNIPPVFKRLSYGLRAKYGQETIAADQPISVVGLEARNLPTIQEALNSVPVDEAGTGNRTDAGALFVHLSPSLRGAVSSSLALKTLATTIGVDPTIINDFDETMPLENRYQWPLDQMRAFVFLPLTDWLEHPLVQRSLQQMTTAQKRLVVQRYQLALQRYTRRINELSMARRTPSFVYRPDWLDYEKEPIGGHNIVDPTLVVAELEDPALGPFATKYKIIADMWFTTIIITESLRFVSESGLAHLMRSQ